MFGKTFFVAIPPHQFEHFSKKCAIKEVTGDSVLDVSGFHFHFKLCAVKKDPKELFSAEEIVDTVAVDSDKTVTILARQLDYEEASSVSSTTTGDSKLAKDEGNDALITLMDQLEPICRFAGVDVDLIVKDGAVTSPLKSKKTLRVALGTRPPGYSVSRETAFIFDKRIVQPGRVMNIPGPAMDVGVVVKNSLDEEVAQIVDDTFFLLLPINKNAIDGLVGGIFEKTIKLAWNAYISDEKPASIEPIGTVEELKSAMPDMGRLREMYTKEHSDAEDEMQEAQVRLQNAMAKLRTYVGLLKGLDELEPTVDHEKAWEKLQQCKYFDRAEATSDNRVHYFSKPIVITDKEGVDRYAGRFGLRVDKRDRIRVWAIDFPHPSDVPHPHINEYGSLCLGNVTESVTTHLINHQETEAVILVLRLLAEGYDETLALNKLEEWPSVADWERRQKR